MAPRGRPPLKREPTIAVGGLHTPGASWCGSNSVSPKREIESIDLSFSDDPGEEPVFKSNHGFPSEDRHLRSTDRGLHSAPRASVSASASLSNILPASTRSQVHKVPQSRAPPSSHSTATQSSNQGTSNMAATPPQGLELVGQVVKLAVDTISDLQTLASGLEHVATLPELVLVGDQSAGKTSLMSALTGILLPRDQGMCTRCPANIKTTEADEWSCSVSLHQEWRYSNPGGRIESRRVTQANPFPPWLPQALVIKDFITVKHKYELEDAIKWAQIALLNPDEDHTLFIPGTGIRAKGNYQHERESSQAKFSPNIISIEISGPGLPALSFYDLPGIFRIAALEKDQYLAKVIENLAIRYIQRPNALIIWTLAMKGDPSTSSTGKVILDCKASNRTVGVLTNPDHVYARHGDYEKILQGKAHIVGHGYYVTKQPGDNSMIPKDDNYHATARAEEKEFFRVTDLWKDEWKNFRPRCGTEVIQDFLSRELARQVLKSIPIIQSNIASRMTDVDQQLRDCPDLPESDTRNIIMKILGEFSSDVCNVMDGEATERFTSEWTNLADQFMDLIRYIKPMVQVSHESDHEIIDLDDDDDNASQISMVVRNGKRTRDDELEQGWNKKQKIGQPSSTPETPTRANNAFLSSPPATGRNVKNENGFPRVPLFAARKRHPPNEFTGTIFERVSNLGKGFFDLAKIKAAIQKYRPGLPGLVNPKTYNHLNTSTVAIWKEPLDIFVNQTIEIVRTQLLETLEEHLGVYKQTELYRVAEIFLKEFIDHYAEEQRSHLNKLFELECYKSFSINGRDVEKHKEAELERLTIARKKVRAKEWMKLQQRLEPKKWKYPPECSVEEKRKIEAKRIDDIVKNEDLGLDPFDNELRVAAYVRGYYVTAANRFVDSVCLSIYGMFFKNIRQNIRFYLERKLGIDSLRTGEENCRRLMAEDDTAANHRRELLEEKNKLVKFSARLEKLVAELQEEKGKQGIPDYLNRNENQDDGDGEVSNHNSSFVQDGDEDMIDGGSDDTIHVRRPSVEDGPGI